MSDHSEGGLRSVVGLFRDYEEANEAIVNLVQAGIREGEMSLLTSPERVEELVEADDREEVAAETAGAGAVGGGALGALLGLLAGAGMLTLPVVGPALATGVWVNLLGVTAVGAGIGAAYGGLAGALIGLGVAEEESELYVEGVSQGGVVLLVRATPDQAALVEEAMSQAGAAHSGIYGRA